MLMALGMAILVGAQDVDPTAGKHIVWEDDFKTDGLPNSDKWSYETGFVRNHEKQYYTTNRLTNARVQFGHLIIEAHHENYQDAQYTSAALESKQSWNHGYFEFKAKIPTGKGTWPAIWFLGDGIRKKGANYINWPLCGEIDLMENVGFDPNKVHFNIHTQSNNTSDGSVASTHLDLDQPWQGWHTYGLDYQAHKLVMYFDGKPVLTYLDNGKGEAGWPFDKPQFIILNLAIGGDWGGQQGVDDGIFPSRFEVEYVKVYQ